MARIAVIGAGIAGLACAWRLQRAGHAVDVFEREPAAGGRMRSERRGEFIVDRGAQFIASGYRNLHALSRELGLDAKIHPVARSSNAMLRGGELLPGDWGSPGAFLGSRLLSAGAKARLARLPFELWRHRKVLDPLRPERAADLDREDLATWARRTIGAENLEYLLGPALSSTFDSDPEHLSGAFALLAMRFVTSGFELQCFEGGIGLLTRTLAERLTVRLGWTVTSVETEPGGAKLRYVTPGGERTWDGDAAVVAVPGTLVAGVCPKLTPAERAFYENVHYCKGMIAFLLFDEAPATLPYYGVAFPRPEGLELYGLAVDHWKPGVCPTGAGIVNAALTEDAAARLAGASDAEIVERVLANLARTPIGRLKPRDAFVHRWDPMLPQFRAGYLPRLREFLARTDRSPRLAFAGDYLVGPYTEAALTSGLRAATEIARSL